MQIQWTALMKEEVLEAKVMPYGALPFAIIYPR